MMKAPGRQRGPSVVVPMIALALAGGVIYANRSAFTAFRAGSPAPAHDAVIG